MLLKKYKIYGLIVIYSIIVIPLLITLSIFINRYNIDLPYSVLIVFVFITSFNFFIFKIVKNSKLRLIPNHSDNLINEKFLYNISHDLRTPIHAISSFASYGLEETDTASIDELKDYFSKIRTAKNRMVGIIERISFVSKIFCKTDNYFFSSFDISSIIHEIIIAKQELIDDKKLNIDFVFPDFDSKIICDKNKLFMAVSIFVDNAIKFSDVKGTIEINLSESENKKEIIVEIKDNGRGFDNEKYQDFVSKSYKEVFKNPKPNIQGLNLLMSEIIISQIHKGLIFVKNDDKFKTIIQIKIPNYLKEGNGDIVISKESKNV